MPAAWTGDADACSVAAPGWVAQATSEVPANGALIVTFDCLTCKVRPDFSRLEWIVTDRDSNAIVAGDVVSSGMITPDGPFSPFLMSGWVAWKPLDGFLVGHRYAASEIGLVARVTGEAAMSGDPTIVAFFAAAAAVPVTPPEREVPAVLPVDRPTGTPVCCHSSVSCGSGESCFTPTVLRTALLRVEWRPSAAWEQYLYRVRYGDGFTEEAWSPNATAHEFGTARDRYCYALELTSLIDGSHLAFDEVCLAPTVTVGEVPSETVGQTLIGCDAPPPGYEDQWVAVRSSSQEAETSEAAGCSIANASSARGRGWVGIEAIAGLAGLLRRRRFEGAEKA